MAKYDTVTLSYTAKPGDQEVTFSLNILFEDGDDENAVIDQAIELVKNKIELAVDKPK